MPVRGSGTGTAFNFACLACGWIVYVRSMCVCVCVVPVASVVVVVVGCWVAVAIINRSNASCIRRLRRRRLSTRINNNNKH